jgi:hypothetical protein
MKMTEQNIEQLELALEEPRQEVQLIKDLTEGIIELAHTYEEGGHDFVSIAATILFVSEGLRAAFPFLADIQFEHRKQEGVVEQGGE